MAHLNPRTVAVRPGLSGAGPRTVTRHSGRLSADNFTLLLILACLLLQRFAVPIMGLPVSVVTPLGYVLVAWGLISGSLAIDRRRAALMLGLCAIAGMAFAFKINMPLAIAPRVSLVSLVYWLVVTGFAVLKFRQPMGELRFFRMINDCLIVVAVAGIIEFVGQFVGIRLFSFKGIIPDKLLIEYLFAVATPMDNGMLRSNGFFLVEPSVFSQYMAIAITIEALYFGRTKWMLVFFAGLISSVSGTGWMVLSVAVLQSAITAGRRGIAMGAVVGIAAASALLLVRIFAPDFFDSFFGRMVEFRMQGTSGNERFVTPFLVLQAVLDDAPRAIFTGIGPGASEAVLVPFKYVIDTPIKVLMEYGVFGLVLYLALFLTANRTRRQFAMVGALTFMLLFTGGYQLFSPILFSVLLMLTVANLREEPETFMAMSPGNVRPLVRTPS
jgi:hypothetical protein